MYTNNIMVFGDSNSFLLIKVSMFHGVLRGIALYMVKSCIMCCCDACEETSSHVALPPGLWQPQGVGPNTEVGSEVLQRVTKHILRPTCHATGAGELRVFTSQYRAMHWTGMD